MVGFSGRACHVNMEYFSFCKVPKTHMEYEEIIDHPVIGLTLGVFKLHRRNNLASSFRRIDGIEGSRLSPFLFLAFSSARSFALRLSRLAQQVQESQYFGVGGRFILTSVSRLILTSSR